MCLTDINTELGKLPAGARIDSASEKRLVEAVLERLDKDTSNDVQALAVKTLSVLVTRIGEPMVAHACEKLSQAVMTGRDELRDIYAIGLKTVIADVPPTHHMASAVVRALLPSLLGPGLKAPAAAVPGVGAGAGAGGGKGAKKKAGAADDDDGAARKDVRAEALDVGQELLRRFGEVLSPQDCGELVQLLVACVLEKGKPAVRKRATATIGTLAPFLDDHQLEQLVAQLLSHIDARKVAAAGSAAARSDSGGAASSEAA